MNPSVKQPGNRTSLYPVSRSGTLVASSVRAEQLGRIGCYAPGRSRGLGNTSSPLEISIWCARDGDTWPEGHKMASMHGLILAMFYRWQGNVESQVGCALWI
jgi:hypothetical protein